MPAVQTLTNFFAGIRRQKTEEAATAEQLYRQLVISVADQKVPSIDETLPVLSDAARTPEDLERDVTRLVQRREWKAILDRLPQIQSQRQQVVDGLEAAREKFRQQKVEFEASMGDLSGQMDILNSRVRECENARVRLQNTADPAFAEEITRLGGEVGIPLDRKLAELQKERERLAWDMRAALREHEDDEPDAQLRKAVTGKDRPSPHLDRYEALKKKAAETDAEIQQTKTDIEQLSQKQQDINQKSLVP